MKVLVLGGTGAIGSHLVQILLNSGIETIVTSRKIRNSEGNLKYLNGDAKYLEFLSSILIEEFDAIIDFMVYSTDEFKDRMPLFLNATKQYFFISSSRIYAESDSPLTEDSPRLLDVSIDKDYLATDEYALAKARQEDLLKHSGKTNWTIIRPYITYSENRLQLGVLEKEEWLYRALKGRTIVFSKDIASKVTTITYGLDVSDGISKLIGETEALGRAFHITTNESRTWNEILNIYLQIIEKQIGFKPKVIFQDLNDFSNWRIAKYQIIYDRLFDRQFDNSKIAEFSNNYTLIDVGLKKCVLTFIKQQKFDAINWKSEAIKDRISNEYTTFNEITGFKHKIIYLLYRYFF